MTRNGDPNPNKSRRNSALPGLRGESSIKECFNFFLVLELASSSDRAGGFTSCVERIFPFMMLGLSSSGVDARTDVTPGTVVERLLLAPEKAGIGVEVKVGSDQVVREGRELFNTADGNVLDASLLTSLQQRVVDLARAKDMSSDLLRSDQT